MSDFWQRFVFLFFTHKHFLAHEVAQNKIKTKRLVQKKDLPFWEPVKFLIGRKMCYSLGL